MTTHTLELYTFGTIQMTQGEITQILLCLVLRKLRNHNDMELMFFEYKHQSTISGSQSQNVLLRPQSGHILISSVPTHSLLWLQVDKHVPAAVTESCKLHVRRAHRELLVLSGSLDVSQSVESSDVCPANGGAVSSSRWCLRLPEDGIHVVFETDKGWGLRERWRGK